MSSKKLNLRNKNPYQEVKAKILEMVYDRENNLFQIAFEDIGAKKQVVLAIKGTDWGITPDVPEDIIEQFCKDMIGKEKNLHIETDAPQIPEGMSKTESIILESSLNKMHDDLDCYPFKEIKNLLDNDNEG